jgi:hypothetical protein
MKILIVVCYILAGLLALLALVLLVQYFAAPRLIENATLGYRVMLGLSGPLVDALLSSLVGAARTLFCLSSALLFIAGGMIYILARLLVRVDHQSLRLAELENRLNQHLGDAPGTIEPGDEQVEIT